MFPDLSVAGGDANGAADSGAMFWPDVLARRACRRKLGPGMAGCSINFSWVAETQCFQI
jgi:hypothetical protein